MARWLLPLVGLAVALAAAWLLLTAPEERPALQAPPVAAPAPAPRAKSAPTPAPKKAGRPMGEIDEASRRELEAVLEREGVGP